MKDLKHLIYFENLLQEANNELVQQARAEGKKALGYTCYFVPETLLNLPGCFSSRLRAPNTGSIDVGTYYMSSKICSYTRSILERGIEGGYDYLDALLSSETCQMMHRGHEHFEILGLVKEKNPQFFMSMMDVPFSDEDFAVDHYEEQLRLKVLEPLHETYGIDISDKAILEAIKDHNEISRIITEIGDLRKAANPVITGYEFHVIQLVSQVCPHKLILPYLRQTLTELKRRKADESVMMAMTMPSSARWRRSRSTALPTSPMPVPSIYTSPAGTLLVARILRLVISITSPFLATSTFFGSTPMSLPISACLHSMRYSPCTGMK